MKSGDSPCWNCAVRKLGCQANCEKYFTYKQRQEEINKRRQVSNMLNGYFRKAVNRSLAFRGDRG